MRATLIEVLGEQEGGALYTMEWLRDRVLWHLDPGRCTGQVFLAEADDGTVIGHNIVRVDEEESGQPVGLFSTTYVAPAQRRRDVATRLLLAGEAWMRDRGMPAAVTDTAEDNVRLIGCFRRQGYEIVLRKDGMVRLRKSLLGEPR